jgi:hypothetical protein
MDNSPNRDIPCPKPSAVKQVKISPVDMRACLPSNPSSNRSDEALRSLSLRTMKFEVGYWGSHCGKRMDL